jgi:hypothetical protein
MARRLPRRSDRKPDGSDPAIHPRAKHDVIHPCSSTTHLRTPQHKAAHTGEFKRTNDNTKYLKDYPEASPWPTTEQGVLPEKCLPGRTYSMVGHRYGSSLPQVIVSLRAPPPPSVDWVTHPCSVKVGSCLGRMGQWK